MSVEKRVVTAAVTGGAGDRSTPHLPVAPEEIARAALESGAAGAAAVHVHVRDLRTGEQSMEFELYQEVVERIRADSDLIVNLTTGPGARVFPDDADPVGVGPRSVWRSPQARVDHVLRLAPEICSLDVGSVDIRRYVFLNSIGHVEWMAERIREAGVRPELEVFHPGHCRIVRHLLESGRVDRPPLVQLCMGVGWGSPATPLDMIAMREALPPDAIWSGFGVGATAFPMVAQAALLGGHVRVGMEDNLYLARGRRAESNAQLVERAVSLLRLLGMEPASPSEAREILGLG